jgi:uncharacterized protein YbjT (DUF2867 family)
VNGARVLVTDTAGLIGTHVLRVLPREAEVVAAAWNIRPYALDAHREAP